MRMRCACASACCRRRRPQWAWKLPAVVWVAPCHSMLEFPAQLETQPGLRKDCLASRTNGTAVLRTAERAQSHAHRTRAPSSLPVAHTTSSSAETPGHCCSADQHQSGKAVIVGSARQPHLSAGPMTKGPDKWASFLPKYAEFDHLTTHPVMPKTITDGGCHRPPL